MSSQNYRAVAETNWRFNTTVDHVTAACIRTMLDKQDDTNQLLGALISRLDSLGTDGLHAVIQYHARVVKHRNVDAAGHRRRRRALKRKATRG